MRSISVRNIMPSKKGMGGIPQLGGKGKGGIIVKVVGGIVIVGLAALAWNGGNDLYKSIALKATGGKASSLSGMGLTDAEKAAQAVEQGVSPSVNIDSRAGVTATVYSKFYDKEAASQTLVYPTSIWVFDSKDNKLVNGAGSNSTTTVRGETLTYYVGGATYYGDDFGDKYIASESPTFNFDVHTIAAETSMAAKGFDSDDEILTADDDADNTADYSIVSGANQEQEVSFKLTNEDSNSLFRLGAIATFAQNDCSDLEITQAGWVEYNMKLPKELKDATLSVANDSATAFTSTGYDHVYVPADGKPIDLAEYDSIKVKAKLTAGTSDPTADTGDNCGVLFIDESYRDGKDGKVYPDFYRHNDDAKVTEVGLSDTVTSPQGLTTGVVIELK